MGADQGAGTEGRGRAASLLRGVPKSLPSLLRAHEIGTRVAAVGFDWAKTADVVDKIEEEVAELRRAVTAKARREPKRRWAICCSRSPTSRASSGIEPESALRKANEKFSARFEALERAFEASGRSVHDATLEEMEAEWQAVKSSQRQPLSSCTRRRQRRRTEDPKIRRRKRGSIGRRTEPVGRRPEARDSGEAEVHDECLERFQKRVMRGPVWTTTQDERVRLPAPLRVPGNRSRLVLFRRRGESWMRVGDTCQAHRCAGRAVGQPGSHRPNSPR